MQSNRLEMSLATRTPGTEGGGTTTMLSKLASKGQPQRLTQYRSKGPQPRLQFPNMSSPRPRISKTSNPSKSNSRTPFLLFLFVSGEASHPNLSNELSITGLLLRHFRHSSMKSRRTNTDSELLKTPREASGGNFRSPPNHVCILIQKRRSNRSTS
jgi:hypothetical protein